MSSDAKADAIPQEAPRDLLIELVGALNFIMAFYEPGQRYLDTNAWKQAEAGGRRALVKGKLATGWALTDTEQALHTANLTQEKPHG